MDKKPIAIYGAGRQGREVVQLLDAINKVNPQWTFIGFFDDASEISVLNKNHQVLGGINALNNWDGPLSLVLAIGSPVVKRKILNKIKKEDINYHVLCHPKAHLLGDSNVQIGEGTVITAGCILTADINIGRHVFLNWNTTIGHDTVIGDYSSIMPAVNISGEVHIEPQVFIGTGAQVVNQRTIGARSIIGAGAVVSKDIPSGCTAVGIPAKPIKFHGNQ